MEAIAVAGAINVASRVASSLRESNTNSTTLNVLRNRSLVDVANVARVEPITMVDADCINIQEIGDIMQSMHSLFSGYYLQAVAMMGSIGGVSVAEKLGPLNPNRSLGFESLYNDAHKSLSMESFKHRLPTTRKNTSLALEEKDEVVKDKAIDSIKEAANLSIGKIYNVQLRDEANTATIPIAIRLMVNVIPTRMMVELFTYRDAFDMDMKERYHAWRSGRLEFVKDLILCNDLIDKRRRSAIKDTNGIMSLINKRESSNLAASFVSGKASVATSSNLAIISHDTLEQIEMAINGKLEHAKTRHALFENTNLMILAVVEKDWERVIFYHRGLDASSNVSFKDLKVSNKGNGMDVGDILKAYVNGSSPI